MPSFMNNKGTYTASLGNLPLARGTGGGAGRRDFPGLRGGGGAVQRRWLGEGRRHRRHGRGARRHAQAAITSPVWSCTRRYTFFAEGARGHLTKRAEAHLRARQRKPAADLRHRPQGIVGHRSGQARAAAASSTPRAGRWTRPWGGGFLYHQANGQVALGLRRRAQLQQPGSRPSRNSSAGSSIRRSGSSSRAAGASPMARAAINEGGWQAVPQLAFPAAP